MKQSKISINLRFILALIVVALVFLILIMPTSIGAHTTEDNRVLEDTLTELRADVNSLESEVQTLRAQAQSQKQGDQPPPFDVSETVVLGPGDVSDDAKELQEVLIYFGYDIPAGATGNFFSQTENALRSFQSDEGITQSGVLDAITYAAIEDQIRLLETSTPVIPTPTPVTPELVIPTPVPPTPILIIPEPVEPEIPIVPEVPSELAKPNQEYIDFYTNTQFTTCMAAHHEAVTLIGSWVINQGLFPYEFPYDQISPAAQEAIVECENEQGRFYEPTYIDCTSLADSSSCSAETDCKWFDTFCGDKDYDPVTGGGSCVGTTEESCTGVDNCHWYAGSAEAEASSCFYPDATIDGTAPGYTVWCEYDYQNCRQGDPSGAEVSLEGLVLGSPNNCAVNSNSGDSPYCYYDSTINSNSSSAPSSSFLANVFTAFSRITQSFQKIFTK